MSGGYLLVRTGQVRTGQELNMHLRMEFDSGNVKSGKVELGKVESREVKSDRSSLDRSSEDRSRTQYALENEVCLWRLPNLF